MALKLLYVLSALDMMNLSLFVVTYAPHVRNIGGSHSQMGIINACFATIALFWNPIAGSLGDNSGRKSVLIKCLSIALFSSFFTIFSSQTIGLIFFFRVLGGFSMPTGTLIRTLVTDVAKDEEKANAMNRIGGLSGIMFMVGALISGFINELPNGFSIIYTIISINLVISLICASFLPNLKPQTGDKKSQENKLFVAFKALKEIDFVKYWELFAIKLFIDLCFGMMQANLGLILNTVFGLKGRQMGFIMTLFSVCGIATNFAMIRLRKTVYANDDGFTRLLHGGMMLVVVFLGLGLTTNLYVLLIFLVLMSIARTLLDATLTDVLTNQTSEADKGGVISLFESILSLTQIVSPLLSGFIADKYTEQTPLLLCTIPALASIILSNRQKSKTKTQ